jgi:hypothetical protein
MNHLPLDSVNACGCSTTGCKVCRVLDEFFATVVETRVPQASCSRFDDVDA